MFLDPFEGPAALDPASGHVRGRPDGAGACTTPFAAEPAETSLPNLTPAQLAAKIREAWTVHERGRLEAEFETTRDTNRKFDFNQGTPEEQKPILVTFPGRALYASDGTHWRVEYDSMIPASLSTNLTPDRWISGFDGSQSYDWQGDRELVVLGESHVGAQGWQPRKLFRQHAESVVDLLERTDPGRVPFVIRRTLVDGLPCYAAEDGKPGDEWHSEYAFAPQRNFLPIRQTRTRFGKKLISYDLHDLREVAPGVWAPGRIEFEWISMRKDRAVRLFLRQSTRIVSFEPRKSFADGSLSFEVPYDTDVSDRRLGYSYRSDPWWDEIGGMLRERFDWPKPDLLPLRHLGTSSTLDLEGKTAPPLRVDHWINSRPLDLAGVRGKTTLLVFWGTLSPNFRAEVPALRRLSDHYRPAGLEMIAVLTPTETPEDVRHLVRESRMESPVAIDTAGSDGQGETAKAYGVQGFPCVFLVDTEGRIRMVGSGTASGGKLVETLVPLLEKAGAKNVGVLSPKPEPLSLEMVKGIDALFQKKAREALDIGPHGRIGGRVVDARGQPIQGAKVQVSLGLTVLMYGIPGAYRNFSYGNSPVGFPVFTDEEGRFDLAHLCKGVYTLRVEAPGKAWVERRATLKSDLIPVAVDVTLGQNGSISGTIRDESGQPIREAMVTPQKRHIDDRGFHRTTTATGLEPLRTDASGRFRFVGIQTGRYAFEVNAPGFESGTLEAIPAGSENVELRLKRSVPR